MIPPTTSGSTTASTLQRHLVSPGIGAFPSLVVQGRHVQRRHAVGVATLRCDVVWGPDRVVLISGTLWGVVTVGGTPTAVCVTVVGGGHRVRMRAGVGWETSVTVPSARRAGLRQGGEVDVTRRASSRRARAYRVLRKVRKSESGRSLSRNDDTYLWSDGASGWRDKCKV